MHQHNTTRNGQPQAIPRRRTRRPPEKRIKNGFEIHFSHTGTAVGNGNHQRITKLVRGNIDTGIWRRVLHGISQNIIDRTLKKLAVSENQHPRIDI